MPMYPQTTAWPNVPYQNFQTAPMTTFPYTVPNQPQPYQQPRMPGMFGRFVNSVSEIAPNEIPTDGTYAIFPTSDLSKIYAKSWNNDGTITTLEFSPVEKSEKNEEKPSDDRIGMILDKLTRLEEQLG